MRKRGSKRGPPPQIKIGKTEIFAQRARVDQAVASTTEKKLKILVNLTMRNSYCSVITFCMLRKLSAIRSESRPH